MHLALRKEGSLLGGKLFGHFARTHNTNTKYYTPIAQASGGQVEVEFGVRRRNGEVGMVVVILTVVGMACIVR